MEREFPRRDHPPRHAIGDYSCWYWINDWSEDIIKSPHRVCKCQPPSRANVFYHIIDNYVGNDPEEYIGGGVMDQNWRNWSLVCADWASVLEQKMFEHRHLSLDSEADMDDILFTLRLQTGQPHRSMSFDCRRKESTLHVQAPPSWDDPSLSTLQTIGGYGWFHIKSHSLIPTVPHHAPATAASLPPEIWTTVGGYADEGDDPQNLSLVCLDWARGCRTEGQDWELYLRSREDMELFVEFTQRQTRFPRLVGFISKLNIYQDPSAPLWFDLLSHIHSDPVFARRLQPAPDRDRPTLWIDLLLMGDNNNVQPLHSSIARSLPWSVSASPRYREVFIKNIRLRSFRELRHIAAAAVPLSGDVTFLGVTWDVAKVSLLAIQLYVMAPSIRIPRILVDRCTNNILFTLLVLSSFSSIARSSRPDVRKSVPLSKDDQDVICALLMNIYEGVDSFWLFVQQYENCAFTCLFDLQPFQRIQIACFASRPATSWPTANICAVSIKYPYLLPSEDDSRTNMIQQWSSALPSILDLPALRTVIFIADKQSKLPDPFDHLANMIGAPPAAVTFRYVYEYIKYDDNTDQFREFTRYDQPLYPPKKWKTKEDMLKDMIQ